MEDGKVKIAITVSLPVVVEIWVTKDEWDEIQIKSVQSARIDASSVREIEEALDAADDLQQLDDAYQEATKDAS
jgi:hypothetical protein